MTESLSTDLFHPNPVNVPRAKPRSLQSQLGQYLTPNTVSIFMAGLFPVLPPSIRLLDAGAGAGALTTAFVSRWQKQKKEADKITAYAYELDDSMLDLLRKTADDFGKTGSVNIEVIEGDFIEHAATMLRLERGPRYTHAILNPPYKKINTGSDHRAFLRTAGLETVNLYSGFVGLAVALMEKGGEVVAIIPRSFCNGPYYQPFRRFVFGRAAIRHIHLFDARNKAFKDDGVLQENIIIRLTCGMEQGEVTISTSTDDSFADYLEAVHPFASIVTPGDAGQFIHIPTGDGVDLLDAPAFGFRLDELGLSVSTGPVVDFRMRHDLRADPEPGTVPLLYPGHFSHDRMTWPKPGFRKANAITHTPETEKWLFPSGFYAVVRRFSSKEERRRIVANVVDPAILQADMIGFENHLNVVHKGKRPLDEDIARGIAVYLNCTAVDQYFRRFNGHTQVNATDLRTMRFPSWQALTALGKWAMDNPQPSQEAIDARVSDLA
jgi:tRNA1(Val) A37 N6-methylase TrmN6